jgi:hypothetical protein
MHTLLNLQGNIPEFILISQGKLHDVNVWDYLVPSPGADYVMDRGFGLLARGDRQKSPRHRIDALHNPTDSDGRMQELSVQCRWLGMGQHR